MKSRAELKEEHLPNVLPTYTQEDIRFTSNRGVVYAIVMAPPTGNVLIKSVAGMKIRKVTLLGTSAKISWKQTKVGLLIHPIPGMDQQHLPVVFKLQER